MTTGLAGIAVGDEVVVTDVNRPGYRNLVVRMVGRKYATIDGEKYGLEDGVVADAYRHRHAFTLAQWARQQAEDALRKAIHKIVSVRFDGLSDDEVRETTAKLEQIAAELAEKAGLL